MQKIERYEIKVTDKEGKSAIGFLEPLRFLVTDIAYGFTVLKYPKFITAGEILIKNLWVKGSPRLQEKGDLYVDACIQASHILKSFDVEIEGDVYSVFRNEPDKSAKVKAGSTPPIIRKKYTCNLSGKLGREALEVALGLTAPTQGNSRCLEAGKIIVKECWVSGDEELQPGNPKSDEELQVMLFMFAYNKIDIRAGEIKKH